VVGLKLFSKSVSQMFDYYRIYSEFNIIPSLRLFITRAIIYLLINK